MMRDPEDRDLEALLREQPLLPLPLALVGRILDEVLPLEPVRPWALVGRAAAVVLIFLTSWLAFSGQAPALADAVPHAAVETAIETTLQDAPALPGREALAEAPLPDAAAPLWLLLGGLLLAGGAVAAARAHERAASRGGDR